MHFLFPSLALHVNGPEKNLNVVPGDEKFRHSSRLKTHQLSQHFVAVNNTKLPDTVQNTVTDNIAPKTVLFTLLDNMLTPRPVAGTILLNNNKKVVVK
jgi:hypothetical protein